MWVLPQFKKIILKNWSPVKTLYLGQVPSLNSFRYLRERESFSWACGSWLPSAQNNPHINKPHVLGRLMLNAFTTLLPDQLFYFSWHMPSCLPYPSFYLCYSFGLEPFSSQVSTLLPNLPFCSVCINVTFSWKLPIHTLWKTTISASMPPLALSSPWGFSLHCIYHYLITDMPA